MRILVTGATGFVGSAVARRLIERGDEVRVLVRAQSPRINLEGLDCEEVSGELADVAALRAAVKGCEGVFHVAADYRLWARRPQEIYATNVEGTRNLMIAARDAGVSRIVYTSSVATLGLNSDGSPADETTPVAFADMVGDYKKSKFLAEAVVTGMAREQDLPVVIVNPSTPIGPGDVRPTPTGRMIVHAASGKMPAYVDTGLNIVHVADVAEGHLLAFEKGAMGKRYILGGENFSLREILGRIAAIRGRRPPFCAIPRAAVLPLAYLAEAWAWVTSGPEPLLTTDGVRLAKKRMYFSSALAQRELGYVARPADEALRDAIAWFTEHQYLA